MEGIMDHFEEMDQQLFSCIETKEDDAQIQSSYEYRQNVCLNADKWLDIYYSNLREIIEDKFALIWPVFFHMNTINLKVLKRWHLILASGIFMHLQVLFMSVSYALCYNYLGVSVTLSEMYLWMTSSALRCVLL